MLASIIRTAVPWIVGGIMSLAALIGLHITGNTTVTELVTLGVSTAYYWVCRAVESRWPGAGRWLLSFGLTRAVRPRYSKVISGKVIGSHVHR